MKYELTVVIPVYNEAGCITAVISEWQSNLDVLGINYHLLVMNDGSTDATAEMLAQFEHAPRTTIVNKQNSGHGPTIREGYLIAAEESDWVFQCDGDNEISASEFAALWLLRDDHVAVFGVRTGRVQSASRALISAISRRAVRLFYAPGVDDVNSPFRLMRSGALRRMIAVIPPETFAPNLAIAGGFAMSGLPIANVPVGHRHRQTGTVSIASWRLVRAAVQSLGQTMLLARVLRVALKGSDDTTIQGEVDAA